MKKFCVIWRDEQDTRRLATWLASHPITGSLWLVGDLGAGKTTFVRYFLQALGYAGAVKSPTYTLVEPYALSSACINWLYHADLYRVQDSQELDFIGFFEYFYQKNTLVIIEWPSRAQDNLPKPDVIIDIKQMADNSRQVCLQMMDDGTCLNHLDDSLIKHDIAKL